MALLPLSFLDSVVAIGKPYDSEIKWVASGFLYGDYLKGEGEGKTYQVYLVTNHHVLQGLKQVLLRFNPQDRESARQYSFDLIVSLSQTIWTYHPNPEIDLAVMPINVNLLKEQDIHFSYFQSDRHIATLNKMAELGISEGDFIYILGFPVGLIGGERNYVIVRSGNIARIQDAINRISNEILIGALVLPGSSGAPVITRPEVMALTGTKAVNDAYLIGLVKSYVTYQDVAISNQTRLPRVIFEENSGLTVIIPADYIQETIKEHQRKFEK